MIRAFRRSRLAGGLAVFGLVALLAVTVSAPLHDGGDDVLCNPGRNMGLQHADRVAAPSLPTGDPVHCVLCHALGTLRAETQSARFAPPPVETRLLALGVSTFVHALFGADTPARAPPTA